jgi:hypothetical protein
LIQKEEGTCELLNLLSKYDLLLVITDDFHQDLTERLLESRRRRRKDNIKVMTTFLFDACCGRIHLWASVAAGCISSAQHRYNAV